MTEAIAVFETDHKGPLNDEAKRFYQIQINDTLTTRFLTDDIMFRIRACHLGDLHVTHAVASPRASERTPSAIERDPYDGIAVQLALAGRSRGNADDRVVDSVPGSILLLDFARPFLMIDEEPRDVVNITIPRRLLAARLAVRADVHGLVLPAEDAALLVPQLSTIATRIDRLPVAAGPVLADHVVNLLLLALGDDPADAVPTAPDRRAQILDRARQLVLLHIGSSDLSPDWMASRLGVSRNDLYKVFGGSGGVSKYIWRQRLDAAQTALRDAGERRRIGEIAFALGFSSEAHFSRAYRAAFGTTATAARRSPRNA